MSLFKKGGLIRPPFFVFLMLLSRTLQDGVIEINFYVRIYNYNPGCTNSKPLNLIL